MFWESTGKILIAYLLLHARFAFFPQHPATSTCPPSIYLLIYKCPGFLLSHHPVPTSPGSVFYVSHVLHYPPLFPEKQNLPFVWSCIFSACKLYESVIFHRFWELALFSNSYFYFASPLTNPKWSLLSLGNIPNCFLLIHSILPLYEPCELLLSESSYTVSESSIH